MVSPACNLAYASSFFVFYSYVALLSLYAMPVSVKFRFRSSCKTLFICWLRPQLVCPFFHASRLSFTAAFVSRASSVALSLTALPIYLSYNELSCCALSSIKTPTLQTYRPLRQLHSPRTIYYPRYVCRRSRILRHWFQGSTPAISRAPAT